MGAAFVFLLAVCDRTGGVRRFIAGKPAAVLASAAGYLGSRAYLTFAHAYVPIAGGSGLAVLQRQTNVIPLAIWTGLGGCWILVVLGLLALIVQKRYLAAAGFGVALAGTIAASLAVVDVTRSMAYCLPAVFVGMAALQRGGSK